MPPTSQTVLIYPADAEFNASYLTLPVVICALPIVAVTSIAWFYYQLAKLIYLCCRSCYKQLKKIV